MNLGFALILSIACVGQVERATASSYIDRIQTLAGKHEYAQALEAVDEIPLELREEMSWCFLRGFILWELARHREAVEEFKSSERRNETASALREYLHGICALEVGEYAEAFRKFGVYVASPPDGRDRDGKVASAVWLSEKGRDGALKYLETPEAQELSGGTSLLWRGILADRAGDLYAAETLVSAFLEAKPHHERGLFWRYVIRQKLGREPDAVRDYALLLRINPAHAGGFDEEKAWHKIATPGDLKYGRWQVERMLADRSKMGERFDATNPLHVWTALGFERTPENQSIVWDSDFRRIDASAYHSYSAQTHCWTIHVSSVHRTGDRKGTELSADGIWSSALFELENLCNRPEFSIVENQARRGEISRRDFALALAELEWGASLRTRAFFALVYFPWATEHEVVPSLAPWFEPSLTFDDRKASFAEKDYYPWEVYGSQYDRLRRHGNNHSPD